MIPFQCRLRDKTHTPIIRNEEIWDYAEALVADYKPELLREPTPINVPHFLESYLGATLDYKDIYFEKGESPIAGATVFNDDRIKVFNREGQCIDVIEVTAGTIIIDNATVQSGNKGYEAFTGLHEGGHFTMHPEVYRRNENQISLFEKPKDGSNVQCCRRDSMFRYSYGRRLTPPQNREHQANTFAAFVAMPRPTFVPMTKELIVGAGFTDGIFPHDDHDWESDWALEKICQQLADAFGVSFTAAKVHLKELGMLMNIHVYEELMAQTKVLF